MNNNSGPFSGGNNVSSVTSRENSFIGVPYERCTCLSSDSYTLPLPLNQTNINGGNFYILRLLIRAIDTSIGKKISFGIRRENGNDTGITNTLKNDWQLVESDRVLFNSTVFNIFVRLEGNSANLSPNDNIDFAAFYIESIDGGGVFKDINVKFQYRVAGMPDPFNGYHAANKRYADK